MNARLRRILPLLLLIALALAVRLPHLGWGLPAVEEEAYPAKKAVEMWGFGTGGVRWDPETAGWPALSFYAQLFLQHLQYGVGRLDGAFADRRDFQVAWLLDPSATILWARALSALLSAAIVAVGALAGRRLAGAAGFWLAGLVLAASPLLVRHAQLVDPDGWVGLFAALAVLGCVRAAESGRLRTYVLTGAAIGLGAAAKYTPALLGVSLLLVHAERVRAEGRSLRLGGLDDRRLWLAAGAALLAFVAASPFTLLDLGVLRRDLAWQGTHMSAGHFGHAGQGPGWLHYLLDVLPAALGWPALVAGVAGLALAARRGPVARVPLWCALPLFLALGALHTRFDRYMIPLLPPLALGAALLWPELRARRPRAARPVVAAVLAAALLAQPAAALWRYHAVQARPSTAALAAAWLREHIDPAREAVLMERYGPDVAPDLTDALENDPALAGLSPAQRAELAERPVLVHQIIPMYSARPELASWFYDLRAWTAYGWIVTSGGVKARYLAEPERFPREAAFYADLARYTRPAATFAPDEGVRGPEIVIHRLDDEGRRRLRAAKGELALAELRASYDRGHRPHLLAAAEAAGRAAERAERWDEAARWAAVLADLIEPARRPLARQRRAVALYMGGHAAAAESLFTDLADQPVVDVTAWGYLGVLAEARGDTARAAACYREVIARDARGAAADLARRRLAALRAAGE